MKLILACTLLLTGCAADRIAPVDGGALRVLPVNAESRVVVAKTDKYHEGFQCFEPLLSALTLGVIPSHCVDTYSVSVTSSTGETTSGTYKSETWAGWASVLLAPLPEWHWHLGYDDGKDPVVEIERWVRDVPR